MNLWIESFNEILSGKTSPAFVRSAKLHFTRVSDLKVGNNQEKGTLAFRSQPMEPWRTELEI